MDTLGSLLQLHRRSTLTFLAADPPAARRDYQAIAIDLPELSAQESAAWERALNKPLTSSGSGAAVATMLLATAVWLGYLIIQGHSLAGDFPRLLQGVVIVICGAALGKVVGLFYWNFVFRRSARRLWKIVGPWDSGAR